MATKVHDVCWNATTSVWLQPPFGGEDGVLHLRSLLKLSGLSDRRHQPLIIGSAGTPALRRHAVTDKARRGRRVMRRRLRPEDLTGRAPCAGLGRRSAKWPSVAAEAEPWAHDKPTLGPSASGPWRQGLASVFLP